MVNQDELPGWHGKASLRDVSTGVVSGASFFVGATDRGHPVDVDKAYVLGRATLMRAHPLGEVISLSMELRTEEPT